MRTEFLNAQKNRKESNGSINGKKPSSFRTKGRPKKEPLEPVSNGPKQEDRDEKGRFKEGNKQGKGNPFARKMGAMRSAFLEAVTPAEVKTLAGELFNKAKLGDWEAAKLFLLDAVGKPSPAVDPDRLDLEEFRLYDAFPSQTQAIRALVDCASPTLVAELIRQIIKTDLAEESARILKG